MFDSRVLSTRAVGLAIAQAKDPPPVWLQASTATIYPHRFDAASDEDSPLGGDTEPDLPEKWRMSVALAKAWEAELDAAPTPRTRRVAMRSAMTMSPDPGSIFGVLSTLARRGLGGVSGKRAAVRVVDPRARFLPRGGPAPRGRPLRPGEPRRAEPAPPARVRARSARGA